MTPWARRLAVFGLTIVLVVLSAAALASNRQQGDLVRRVAAATAATDAYQEARHLADVQHARHEEALAAPDDAAARAAHRDAATNFLAVVQTLRRTDPDDIAALDQLVIEQGRYVGLTERFFALATEGQITRADRLHDAELEPVEDHIRQQVEALAAKNRAASNALYRQLLRHTDALNFGTPAALAAGLLLLGLFAMITRSYRRTVEDQAAHDSLTGLPNRSQFQQRCVQALRESRRNGTQAAVLLLDLNDFKQVNDTLGHHYGDELLTRVAERLAGAIRPGDTVARMGGDEFAVLLATGGAEAAENVAERINAALGRPFVLDGITLDARASIGIAATTGTEDMLTLVQRADAAMYVAKHHRLRFAHYTAAEQDQKTVPA